MADIESTIGDDVISADIFIQPEINQYVMDLINYDGEPWEAYNRVLRLKYKFKTIPRRVDISYAYRTLLRYGKIERNMKLEEKIMKIKNSASGVAPITIATRPDKFSCKFNCAYCPNEPDQPRSYLSDEPVLVRANKYAFDVVKQFYARARTLHYTENRLDKLEVIVVGGTWSCYDHKYQEEFVCQVYYAANIFFDMLDKKPVRACGTLDEEQNMNETAQCRIISLTLETRPDMITPDEIIRLRHYGCTRVQIGVQHINDSILKYVNRGCSYADIIRAIKLLKDNGFKIDIHIMPNLPSSTPEEDIKMFDALNNSPELQADQWKIYPCEVVKYSKIHEWFKEGKYTPYPETSLKEVLKYAMTHVQPYVRINRVIRDILMKDVYGGISDTGIRATIQKEMENEGIISPDIRSREIKTRDFDSTDIELFIRRYPASDGIEYFISHESHDHKIIYSLLRLRINNTQNMCVFPFLQTCTMIRELHVYGKMLTHDEKTDGVSTQHRGLGRQLIEMAEKISQESGFHQIAVISGAGVRGYYRKLGFELVDSGYMIKKLIY